MRPFEVVYLTGPPATGKTTLVERIEKSFPQVRTFVYSKLLSQHVSSRGAELSQTNLRENSARVIREEDVDLVDDSLIAEVIKVRQHQHVLIDSHAVTKERYGFRITPFQVSKLLKLAPTRVCMLFTTSDIVIERIAKDPSGRPQITPFEADFHCFAQASVATNYGIQLGVPVYLYDVSNGSDAAFSDIVRRFQ